MRASVSRRRAVARGVLTAVLAAALASCATPSVAPPVSRPPPAAAPVPSPRLGRRFDVVSSESTLVVLVYRAGALAAVGHNHVIGCRCLSGTVYLPHDPLRASLELRLPVRQLTVDDPALRSAEHSRDFPPGVTPSDRQGTRHNMLSAAFLNAAGYPDITISSERLRPAADGKPGNVVARLVVQAAGERRSITVPLHYKLQTDRVIATGQFLLKQTDLGLKPITALGGALRVRDGMQIRLTLVAARRHAESERNRSPQHS